MGENDEGDLTCNIKYSNGQQAILLLEDGSGFVYYPNGQPAICFNRVHGGIFALFYNNSKSYSNAVVCSFDPHGIGSATFPDGKPRLISEKERGSLSAQDGTILKTWDYKRPNKEWIEFNLSSHMTIKYLDCNNIVVRFNCEGVARDFPVGHVLKYTKNYLDRVTGQIKIGPQKGKFIIPAEGKCRQASAEYAKKAVQLKEIRDTDLKSIVDTGKEFQKKAARGDFHVVPYIEKDKQKATLEKLLDDDIAKGLAIANIPNNVTSRLSHFLDQRNPTLEVSRTLKSASGRYRSFENQGKQMRRRKLPMIAIGKKGVAFERYISKEVPATQLIAVCCLAHWNPTSRKIETLLEDAYGQLSAECQNDIDNSPYRMVKVEMSESRYLNEKYNITTVPMFLFYLGGKLLFANSHFNGYGNSAADFLTQLKKSLNDGHNGRFLSPDFRFGLTSDNVLGATKEHMQDKFHTKV